MLHLEISLFAVAFLVSVCSAGMFYSHLKVHEGNASFYILYVLYCFFFLLTISDYVSAMKQTTACISETQTGLNYKITLQKMYRLTVNITFGRIFFGELLN